MMRGVRGLIAPFACAVVIAAAPGMVQARTLYFRPAVCSESLKLTVTGVFSV